MGKEIKKLYRSHDNRIIWGVGGGLAKYFEVDITLARLILAAFVFITGGLAILFYIFAALIIPNEPGFENELRRKESAGPDLKEYRKSKGSSGILIGTVIFIVGFFGLANKLFPLYWLKWSLVWPILLMILGLIIIIRSSGK